MSATVPWTHTRVRELRVAVSVAFVLAALPGGRVEAQFLPAAAGAAGGLASGVFVTTAVVVLEARTGRYIYGPEEMLRLRPEILPILAGPVIGAALGASSPARLGRAGIGAAIGLAGGAVVGTAVGQLLWRTSEGRWAGGIIGGAAGLVVGAIVRAAESDDESDPPVANVVFSVPVPWGRDR